MLGIQGSWNVGHGQEKTGCVLQCLGSMRPSGAREVQAALEQFVKLDLLGLTALVPSRMQIPREYLKLVSCWSSLQWIQNLLGEID